MTIRTVHQQIASRFIERLAESKQFDRGKIKELRKLLLTDQKRPKAEDFVKVFLLPAGGDVT